MKSSTVDILIVGAGLAGLSAAIHLPARCRFRIVEAARFPGGTASTNREGTLQFDQTGHLLHLRNVEIERWITGLMKNELLLIHRVSRIWSHGVYTRYPFQSNTYGLPDEVARECVLTYFQALLDPNPQKIRTFADFILVHFGAGFAKHFMIPYNQKIWGVHPKEMTAAWCQRFVPIPAYQSILEGMFPAAKEELGYNSAFYYPKHGIQGLADRLAEVVEKKQSIEYGVSVVRIDHKRRLAHLSTGEAVVYRTLITTMPLNRLVNSLTAAPKKITAMGKKLRYNPLQYLDVVIRSPKPPFFHWCYVPSPDVPFYRIGVYSNFSSVGVPRGQATLYVELASRAKPQLRTLVPRLAKELMVMKLITSPADILAVYPRRIDCAYVIYDHAYEKTVPPIQTFLRTNHIFSIGRYGTWEYASMEDALIQGKETAAHIARTL